MARRLFSIRGWTRQGQTFIQGISFELVMVGMGLWQTSSIRKEDRLPWPIARGTAGGAVRNRMIAATMMSVLGFIE